MEDGDGFAMHGGEGSRGEGLWSGLHERKVDDENFHCALVESRYTEEVDVVISQCHHRLISSRVCSGILCYLICRVSGQVWLLHVNPGYRRRLGSLKGTHIKGIEFGLGIGIKNIGVMVENGCKVGRVKWTCLGCLG